MTMIQNNLQTTKNVVEINEEELQELTVVGGKGSKWDYVKDGVKWTLEKSNDWCPTGACSSQC
ncbi:MULTISPECIES: hypothetical protein [Staphylococcus]|uniref:hypothetical protein n=1 Tax=Staphylococcus TaxID=1279 RepID=UPI0021A8A801|nr:hypothetical protein [Staphylococcus epidermidis]MCT1513164.1 hypothetical protein [Staphylococcus epidermidis]